jgi:non-ribosomal peptide synthetase component F
VIGVLAIEMIGGVYCPFSPRDPEYRLYALMQQTHSRIVLVHFFTNMKFNNNIVSFDIGPLMTNKYVGVDIDVDQLSDVFVTVDNIAYVVFTSGSTGIPKTVGCIL